MADDLIKLLNNAAAKAKANASAEPNLPRAAMVVFLAGPTEHASNQEWELVEPVAVPADIATPQTIGVLLAKNDKPMVAYSPTTRLWYRAFDAEEIKAVAANYEKEHPNGV